HPTPRIPWVDVATGSLGQGLPYAVGMAIAGKRLDRLPFRVWTLCGDIEIDGHDVDAIDRAYAEAIDTAGQPVVIVAKTIKGKGDPDVEDKNGFHGKALDHSEEVIATLGGVRNLEIEVAKPETGDSKHEFPSETLELPRYELGAEVATRKAYGDALVALGKARGDVVALD